MGQSSLPIWLLGTIEFIWAGWIPLNPHHKIIPSQKYVFRDPKIAKKTSPGKIVDLGVPKSDPGLQNPDPDLKKQKMRAEKPCRTPPSEFQTEPYSASYGPKPFWGQILPIEVSMMPPGGEKIGATGTRTPSLTSPGEVLGVFLASFPWCRLAGEISAMSRDSGDFPCQPAGMGKLRCGGFAPFGNTPPGISNAFDPFGVGGYWSREPDAGLGNLVHIQRI